VIPAPLDSPRDLDAPVGELVEELCHHLGTSTVVGLALDLLGGTPGEPGVLRYLNGIEDTSTWPAYWQQVWGARALLYVWSDDAGPAVVAGLSDPAWRVAETCLRVAVRRELAEACDGAVRLAGHRLPRVRGHAARLLGVAGEREHLETVQRLLTDDDEAVRRHAARALERLERRLDLV
jgi:HEAT repeat protein